MVVISRKLPASNSTRRTAIARAFFKMNNLGTTGMALTGTTQTRLNAMDTAYDAAYELVAQRQAEQIAAVLAKNLAVEPVRLLAKHFIGVFNYGVERGKYPAGDRAYFHIAADNGNLPELGTEMEVINLANVILTGDATRVTAGGAAMSNPTAIEVGTAVGLLTPLVAAAELAKEALDSAQEALDALNIEADKLIKRIWDEVETYYDEEAAPSKRASARLWGLIYISRGAPATLSGLVKSPAGAAIEGATVAIDETGATATTNHEGRFVMETSVVGIIHITAAFPALADITIEFEIPEHEEGMALPVPDITLG